MRSSFALCGALALAGCSKAAEPPAPEPAAAQPTIDWGSAFTHQVRFDPATAAVVVDVTVAPGFHAYTTGEQTGRPLKLEVTEGATLDGPVLYPKGITKNLPVGRSVIVEGQAQVVGKVKDATGAVKGRFHYQVCTAEICDRPRKAAFEVAPGG